MKNIFVSCSFNKRNRKKRKREKKKMRSKKKEQERKRKKNAEGQRMDRTQQTQRRYSTECASRLRTALLRKTETLDAIPLLRDSGGLQLRGQSG